jgi:hypothetical protein
MNCPVCGADNMKTLMSRAIGAVTMRHRQCQDCDTEWWAQVQETIVSASVVPGRLEEAKQLPLMPAPENVHPCTPVDISDLDGAEGDCLGKCSAVDISPGENVQGCTPVNISPAPRSSNREEKSKKKISECSEPGKYPALVIFPVVGDPDVRTWGLTQPFVDKLVDAYPGVDVVAEAKRALVWVEANPTKRKTGDGMPRFLAGWLTRSTNSGNAVKLGATPQPKSKAEADRARLLAMYPPFRKSGAV